MTKNHMRHRCSEPARNEAETGRSVISRDSRNGLLQLLVHVLAQGLRSVHYGIGMTTLSTEATPVEEQRFVLFWASLLLFLVLFFAGFLYLLR